MYNIFIWLKKQKSIKQYTVKYLISFWSHYCLPVNVQRIFMLIKTNMNNFLCYTFWFLTQIRTHYNLFCTLFFSLDISCNSFKIITKRASFFFYSCHFVMCHFIYIYHASFNQSPGSGHLDCIQSFAAGKSATVNNLVCRSFCPLLYSEK